MLSWIDFYEEMQGAVLIGKGNMEGEMVHFMQVINSKQEQGLTLFFREITNKALKKKRVPPHKLRECFMCGANTTCCHHIQRFHFEEYKCCVQAAKPQLEVHHTMLPQWYLDQFTEKLRDEQTQLKFWPKGEVPVSTRERRLKACAQYIVVENQVYRLTYWKLNQSADHGQALMTADKITIQNILLSAKPYLQKNNLPSLHDVLKFIKSLFIDHVKRLKAKWRSVLYALINLCLNTLPVNPGQSLYDCRWMDSRKCEDGILGLNSSLDLHWPQYFTMVIAIQDCWFLLDCLDSWWQESWEIHGWNMWSCRNNVEGSLKGMLL